MVAPLPLRSPTVFHRGRLSGRSCSVCSAMTCRLISMSNPSFTPTTLTCWTGRSPSPKSPSPKTALKARIENTLCIMQNWYRSNSLKMNPQKTEFMMIGSRQNIKKTEGFHLVIDNVPVPPSGSLRMLGVVLDPILSWEKHISHVVQKCNALLISLYRFRHHFSQDILQKLINIHVFPHIIYCLSVWGGPNKTQLVRIQKTINFAARVVTGAGRTDRIGPTLQALGWERVERLVEMKDAVKMYKLLTKELGPPAIRSMFVARSAVSHRSRAVGGDEGCRQNVQAPDQGARTPSNSIDVRGTFGSLSPLHPLHRGRPPRTAAVPAGLHPALVPIPRRGNME